MGPRIAVTNAIALRLRYSPRWEILRSRHSPRRRLSYQDIFRRREVLASKKLTEKIVSSNGSGSPIRRYVLACDAGPSSSVPS